jgi:hypothetical protein
MFSKFFEKNKSNGQLFEQLKKKKRDPAKPNISSSSTKLLSSTSHSPPLTKPHKTERKTSPGLPQRQSSNPPKHVASSSQPKKLKKITRSDSHSKEPETRKTSNSPKQHRKEMTDFLQSKGLKGIGQFGIGARPTHPVTRESTQRTTSMSKKILVAISKDIPIPRARPSPTVQTQKPSRESSQQNKKRPGEFSAQPTLSQHQSRLTGTAAVMDFSKTIDKADRCDSRKKLSTNSLFLMHAKKNEAEKCLQLISSAESFVKGADINCQDKDGWTGLHHASWNENIRLVNTLLYNEASVAVKDSGGRTALFLSVIKGNAQISKVGDSSPKGANKGRG